MTSALHPTLQLTGRDPMGGLKGGDEAARGGVAGGMGCMLHAFSGHHRGNGACQSKVSHPGGPVLPDSRQLSEVLILLLPE